LADVINGVYDLEFTDEQEKQRNEEEARWEAEKPQREEEKRRQEEVAKKYHESFTLSYLISYKKIATNHRAHLEWRYIYLKFLQ
jgi:hypothetical protein